MGHERLAALTIDLDSLYNYARIFGDNEADYNADTVYTRGIDRFVALCDAVGAKGTFFAVGRDVTDGPHAAENAKILKRLAAAGHEIANHTFGHPYGLTRMDPCEIHAELRLGREALEGAIGGPVTGFRAPGYNVNAAVFAAAAATGHTYDASHFPCVPYQALKAVVVTLLKATGRPSRSVLTDVRLFAAPLVPYRARLDNPYAPAAPGAAGIAELPITVSPFLRLPLLGSFLALAGHVWFPLARPAFWALRDFMHFEFHGLDFLSVAEDGLPAALARQPDTRIAVAEKQARFEAIVRRTAADYEFVTLREAARRRGLVAPTAGAAP